MKYLQNWLLALSLTTSPLAWAGSISGGGGDWRFLEADKVWFTGADQVIRVCYDSVPEFGLGPTELEASLRFALDRWIAYAKAKHIPEQYQHRDAELALRYQILSQCDGKEDLKIYFGNENKAIAEARTQFQRPVSFAKLAHYDWDRGWAQGFIWLALPKSQGSDFPDWSIPEQLQGMLLHELGHVFGCGHAEGTIMSDKIVILAMLSSDPQQSGARIMLQQIDQQRELVLDDGAFEREGWLAADDSASGYDSYGWLAGRPLVRPVKAKLRRIDDSKWEIIGQDAQGSFSARLKTDPDYLRFPSEVQAFRLSNHRSDAWTPVAEGQVFAGSIEGKGGETRQILLSRNASTGEGVITIHLLQGAKKRILFGAGVPMEKVP